MSRCEKGEETHFSTSGFGLKSDYYTYCNSHSYIFDIFAQGFHPNEEVMSRSRSCRCQYGSDHEFDLICGTHDFDFSIWYIAHGEPGLIRCLASPCCV